MANTYTQCYIHLIFATKNRNALIDRKWRAKLEKYITGIIQNNNHKLLAIFAMTDHIHILIGYKLNQTIPSLVDLLKASTNNWINSNNLTIKKFEWQKG